MKKIQLLIALLLFMASGFCQEISKFDWKNPVYLEARAYFYALDREGDCGLVIQNKSLNKETIDIAGHIIDKNRLDKILEIIANPPDSIPPDKQTFYVFSPHHGIVFFNEDEQPIAHISVCFISGNIHFSPENNDYSRGYVLFSELFNDVGYPVFNRPEHYSGYSRRFNDNIETTENPFAYCDVTTKPKFQYKDMLFDEYLNEHLFFEITDSLNYDKKISFSFIVEKTGDITFQKIFVEKMDLEENRLFIALNELPNWLPGKNGDEKVRTIIKKTIYLKK